MAEISKEYAEALFALGIENGLENEFLEDLELIRGTFEDTPDFLLFLSSPGIPMDKRTASLDEAFGDSVREYVLSMTKLLCEKGRISLFQECIEEYDALLKVKNMKAEAKVTSAVELTAEERSAIRARLEKMYNKSVELKEIIDPSILGGVIIELDGNRIDGSLRNKLRDVKDVMKQ